MQLIKPWPTLSFTSNFPSQDVERTKLRELLYDTSRAKARAEPTNDGDLVYAALRSNCDYFLTHDKKLLEAVIKNEDLLQKIIGKLQIVNLRALGNILGLKL